MYFVHVHYNNLQHTTHSFCKYISSESNWIIFFFLCCLLLELISSSCWVYCCPSWAEIPQTNLSLSPTVLSECCLHLLLAKWPKLCKNCCLWKHTEDTWKKTRTLFVTKLHLLGMLMGVDTENVPEYTRWYVRWLLATSFNRMMLTPLCNSWNSEWTIKF